MAADWRAKVSFLLVLALTLPALALEKPETTYKIFQFPANMIPRIDGNADDWSMVPESYVIGTDQLGTDTAGRPRRAPDPKSLDVKVKVGWVKGLNRLYFLYEAYDDYWDFTRNDLNADIFELIVDGDRSGGPFIDRFLPGVDPATTGPTRSGPLPPTTRESTADMIAGRDAWYNFHGHHAQNYHIFTPAEGKDWCMAWGPQANWIKQLPYSNIAYNYKFKAGESGKLIMEFWITPFDYAAAEGPERSVESKLEEGNIIGLSWAILDSDDVRSTQHGFWNLSPKHTMYGQASELCAFKLMGLEQSLQKPIDAQWSFKVVDLDRRVIAFHDDSTGQMTGWKWDFGDGQNSTDQHPVHAYAQPGRYIVTLEIDGPAGKSKRTKVWDVTLE